MSQATNPYGDQRTLITVLPSAPAPSEEIQVMESAGFEQLLFDAKEEAEQSGIAVFYFMDVETFKKHAHKLTVEEVTQRKPQFKTKLIRR